MNYIDHHGSPSFNHIHSSAIIVEKLCEYMSFKAYYEKVGPKEEIPVQEFIERLAPELALEL